MNLLFTNPGVLWALAALLVPAILLMVLPRAQRIRVSSLQFWLDPSEDITLEKTRRLRRLDAASVLLLAALALLVIALAGPTVVRRERQGVALTVIVDRSASLGMPVGGGSGEQRLATLGRRVDEFLAGLPREMQVDVQLLPQGAGGDELVAGVSDGNRMTGKAAEVRPWLERHLRVVERGLEESRLRQAAQAARDRSGSPVLLVTDVSPYAGGDGGSAGAAGIWLLTSGGAGRNAWLKRAVVQQREEGYFALVEYGVCGSWAADDLAGQALVVADSGGRTLISVAVDFADGGGAVSFALPDGVERADGLQVRLDVADDLSWDNQLELSRVEVRRSRVGYVGRRDEDLQWLLPLTGADVVTAEDADDLPADVDVTFFVDRLPGATFRGAAVVVNPAGPVGPVVPGEYEADAAILTVADSGLGGVLPEEVAVVRRWRSATLGPGVQVVLKDRQSGRPVVVRYLTPGGMVLVVLADLDPGVTDWASRPSYAVFWSAVLGELTPRAARRLEYRAADGEWASRIDGGRCEGEAVDELSSARRAAVDAERRVRPTVLGLWPFALMAAMLALAVRLWVQR